jgi:hypothetical protein
VSGTWAAETLSSGAQLGRYFSLVSIVSSSTLVLFVMVLVGSGAVGGEPSASALAAAITDTTLADIGLIALLTLVVGLVLHPLQYAFVQVLEGYWGTSRLAVRAAGAFVDLHHRRMRDLKAVQRGSARLLRDHAVALDALRTTDWRGIDRAALGRQRRRLVRLQEEALRLIDKYPVDEAHVMPTALGNRLRRAEDMTGTAYGLTAAAAVPRVAVIAEGRDYQYFEDTVGEVDVAVRFCVIWTIATVLGTAILWPHGWWLLVPAGTYALAYLSYRGAAVAAEEHGAAMQALVDLNRFALYDRMGLPRPVSAAGERNQNRGLMRLLGSDNGAQLPYAPPPGPTTPPVP